MKRKFIKTALLAFMATVPFSSFIASAGQASSEATVKVQNSFDFNAGDAMNFGIIRVTNGADNTDFASVTIPANGGNPVYVAGGDKALISVLDSTDFKPATFIIAGASNFTNIQIDAIADVEMTTQDAAPGGPTFTLSDFTYSVISGNNAGDSGSIDGSASLVSTDIDGAATFAVGGTLTTSKTVFSPYGDVNYTGNVVVNVDYP